MADIPPDYFERFVHELEGIHQQVTLMNETMPEKIAQASKSLADFYEQGHSTTASRPGEIGEAPGTGDSGASSLGSPGEVERDARRAAAAEAHQGAAGYDMYGIDPSTGRTPGGPSRPPSQGEPEQPDQSGQPWWSKYTAKAQQQSRDKDALSMFNLAEARYTTQDIFEEGARMLRAGSDRFGGTTGSVMGGASTVLQMGANAMPHIAMMRQAAQRAGLEIEPKQLEAQGAAMGVSPAGSDIQVGPLGFRPPFVNDAAQASMQREFQIQKDRMRAGLNGQQVRTIWDTLQEHGFTPRMGNNELHDTTNNLLQDSGDPKSKQIADIRSQATRLRATPGFDEIRFGMEDLTKKHPEMLNPQTFDQLDKAVRQGSGSMKDFTEHMGRVSDVAARTGYSFSQLQQDMLTMGDQNAQQGGTNWSGQKKALAWQSTFKGIPAAAMVQFSQNPLVQATTFRETGLMPFQQGLATQGQQGNAMVDTVMQMYNAMALPAVHSKLGGEAGKLGFKNNVSQEDARIAQESQLLGMKPEVLKNIIHHQKTFRARNDLSDAARSWSQQIQHIQGNKTLSKDEKNRRIAELAATDHQGRGHFGDLQTLMDSHHGDFSKKERDQVLHAGMMHFGNQWIPQKSAADAAKKRAGKIQSILDKKDKTTKDESQNKITVELGPGAKKIFHLVDPQGKAKTDAQAGGPLSNSSYAQGPTSVPPV